MCSRLHGDQVANVVAQVWALSVSSDERTIVSGAADSVVTFWEDCTEEQEAEKENKRADLVLKYVCLHLTHRTCAH